MNVITMTKPDSNAVTFEDFWKQCPKKTGKPLAKAKFDAITNGGLQTRTLDKDSGTYVAITLEATPEELVEGMKRYRRSQIDESTFRMKDGGKYLLHPATFLNQGRWMDG